MPAMSSRRNQPSLGRIRPTKVAGATSPLYSQREPQQTSDHPMREPSNAASYAAYLPSSWLEIQVQLWSDFCLKQAGERFECAGLSLVHVKGTTSGSKINARALQAGSWPPPLKLQAYRAYFVCDALTLGFEIFVPRESNGARRNKHRRMALPPHHEEHRPKGVELAHK